MRVVTAISFVMFASLVWLADVAPVQSASIAISEPNSVVGKQGGGPYNVGNIFTVNSNGIIVTDIGIFASTSNGTNAPTPMITATNPVAVGIFSADGSQTYVPFTTLTAANTSAYASTGDVVLNTFQPVTLRAGTYMVVASDVGALPAQTTDNSCCGNGNPTFDTGGGLISIPTNYGGYPDYYSGYSSTLGFRMPIPGSTGTGDTNLYTAGTFVFIATPEPSSLVLCGLGAVALLVGVRRRRKA